MEKRGYTTTENAVPADGTPTNRYGHRYCVGVKPFSWNLANWLRA